MIRPWCNSHSATFMLLFFPVEIFPLTYFLHSKNIQPYCSRRAFSVHIYILSWDWYTNDPVENESFDHRHDQQGVVGRELFERGKQSSSSIFITLSSSSSLLDIYTMISAEGAPPPLLLLKAKVILRRLKIHDKVIERV